MQYIFIVTVTGAGIDTDVTAYRSHETALTGMGDKFMEYHVTDSEEMCVDCFKGYSPRAQCDVEFQIHKVVLPN